MVTLKSTPVQAYYAKYGGKTIDFGGWELPVQFSGIQQEHHAVRGRAGLFDVSHMGEFRLTGSDAEAFLQQMMTNDVSKLAVNQAQYTLMCYPNGGVVDDLLVYKLGEQQYMLVVNAANIAKDLEWLQKHLEGDIQLEDISEETALLALQGPKAERILQKHTSTLLGNILSFHFVQNAQVGAYKVLISRTGYTGEDGFELYVQREDAGELWDFLLTQGSEDGLVPVGLGARDTLRFEARLPLYGQELSPEISPLEAGLGYFVKWDKGDFIGRDMLLEQKQKPLHRKLVGIEMIERGIPRAHYPVYNAEAIKIGEITTGTQSPTLKSSVGIALVEAAYSTLDTELWVEIRGKRLLAKVIKTPFYKRMKS